MRVHSDSKINEIKELRQKGYSINQIVGLLAVPKTTVWHHIKGVIVPTDLKKILQSNRGGSAARSKREWVEADDLAKKLLNGAKSKLVIAASMLYWGEGGKKTCDITNTDPKPIQLYLKFLNDALGIKAERIKFTLRIFTGMDMEDCLMYWAKSLNINRSQFIVRYNDGGVSGKAKYGICRIAIKKGRKVFKLMHSLISLGFSDIMGINPPLSIWMDYKRPIQVWYILSSPHSSTD